MQLQKWNSIVFVLLLGCSIVGYSWIGYHIERGDSLELLTILTVLSTSFLLLLRFSFSLRTIFIIGLFFRLLFLFALPELSQDFYRFLWDGNIQLLGINPYSASPNTLIDTAEFPLLEVFYNNMGGLSAMHYSSYPPLSQYLYQSVMYFNQESLLTATIVLRIWILFFEFIVFAFGVLILRMMQLPDKLIGWYFLNPLVIIEVSGNLHGEGAMLALCLAGIYFIFRKQLFWGAFFISLSIATKLIPLLLLPVLFYYLGWKRFLIFASLVLVFSLSLWLPFLESNHLQHYLQTVRLWFNTFEFNASSYYIVREIGYKIKGYNIIRSLGKITPLVVMGTILCFSFLRNNKSNQAVLKSMLLILSVYFFMATTVHPWYVISLVILGLFCGYLYPMIWSVTVFLSYSAYGEDSVKEIPLLIALEYLPVYVCFFYEMFRQPLLNHFQKTNFLRSQSPPISAG